MLCCGKCKCRNNCIHLTVAVNNNDEHFIHVWNRRRALYKRWKLHLRRHMMQEHSKTPFRSGFLNEACDELMMVRCYRLNYLTAWRRSNRPASTLEFCFTHPCIYHTNQQAAKGTFSCIAHFVHKSTSVFCTGQECIDREKTFTIQKCTGKKHRTAEFKIKTCAI